MGSHAETPPTSLVNNCWFQLAVGIAAMVAVANMQYSWTFFVEPLHQRFLWDKPSIQIAFTLFVLAETWLVPVEGLLVDRLGPRLVVGVGAILVGLAWVINTWADSLTVFYITGALGGAGAGAVYGTCIASALKWFPHRRGLAAGITAGAFGGGSALTVLPIRYLIDQHGYQTAFLWFGLAQGAIVLICAVLMRAPHAANVTGGAGVPVQHARRDLHWLEVLRSPVFWLMYVMLVLVALGGLMLQAQVDPISRDYQVAHIPVYFLGMTTAVLTVATILERLMSGLTRPFFGWVSDHVGRPNAMFIAFTLEGVAMLLFVFFAGDPLGFMLLMGLIFFFWGELFSLFPALCGDLFGRKYATTNYGLLYTAKGTASLFIPLGVALAKACGSWVPIFCVFAVCSWVTALLAILVLKPLVQRWLLAQVYQQVELRAQGERR